jgi:hypothetical protein
MPIVTVQGASQVCSNELPLTLTAQATTAGTNYLWNNQQTTASIQVSSAGSYSLTFTDTNNCIGKDTLVVTINNSPSINAGLDLTVCEYDFPITVNATGNGSSILWNTGATTPFISVTQAGTYTVTTTASNGCQATDAMQVFSDDCASLTEESIAFSVYPNPTSEMVIITSTLNTEASILVYNLEGKIVQQARISGNEKQINLAELSKGTYLLKVINALESTTFRIIKL